MKNKRKSMSKRLRFAVFARDKFTCRYCGRQSDQVPLVVDHVLPVCEGGTNEEVNLVTACVECNQGKAGKKLDVVAPNETDRLRLAQEMQEQMRAARMAADAAKAVTERMQSMVNFWCGLTGYQQMDGRTAKVVYHYVQEFGEELVYEWIEKAHSVCGVTRLPGGLDRNMGRYVSGIRRNVMEQGGQYEC